MLLYFNFSTELCELTNYFSPLLSPFWYDMDFKEERSLDYFFPSLPQIMHTIEDNKIKPKKKDIGYQKKAWAFRLHLQRDWWIKSKEIAINLFN